MSDSDIELELEEITNTSQLEKISTPFNKSRFEPYKMYPATAQSIVNNAPQQLPPLIQFQTQELTALTNSLPEFKPDSNLSTFISSVDNLVKFIDNKLTPTQYYLFNVSVLAKIKNEARDYLNFHNEVEWPGIRQALLRKYGDQRNEELLISALRSTIQTKNETFNDYYDKILLAQNDLLQYVQLHEENPNIFLFKKSLFQRQTVQMFCSGLLEPYRSYIMNFDLNNLEEALNKCRMYDNKIKENNYTDYVRKLQNERHMKPTAFIQPARPAQFTPRQTFPIQNTHFSNFQQKQQPQFQPRPFASSINKPFQQQARFPTNKQVFGTKPGSTMQRTHYSKPTPMSVQTSAFSRKPNQYQAANRPAIISEELFNNETETERHFNQDNYENFEIRQPEDEELYFQPSNGIQENCYEEENFHIPASENSQLPST